LVHNLGTRLVLCSYLESFTILHTTFDVLGQMRVLSLEAETPSWWSASIQMPCTPPSTDVTTLFARELPTWHQICGSPIKQGKISVAISSQRCFVDSPLWFLLRGDIVVIFFANTKVKKCDIYSIFIGFLCLFVMAAIQATSMQMMFWETCSKILWLQENNFLLAEHGAWHWFSHT
jgi:hypothetical protein